jgi:hypothetical protein
MDIRESEFQAYLPEFGDADIAKFFEHHGDIVSMKCEPGPNDTLAVMFATRFPERFGPFALNRIVAAAFYRHLSAFVENPAS